MNNATPVEKIRQVIAWQLGRLGVREPGDMREAMLIQNGLYCGRRFHCEDYECVWFLEEDEIKFFSPVGELLLASSAIAAIREHEQLSLSIESDAASQTEAAEHESQVQNNTGDEQRRAA